jgi:hypothetical protein
MSTNHCNHDWQPIPNWFARYRCSICRVVGVPELRTAPVRVGVTNNPAAA